MDIKFIDHGLCQIRAKSVSELEPIRNHFKTENGSKFYVEYHSPQFSAPDFIYGISSIGVFKVGMLPLVIKVMKSLGIQYNVEKDILREFFPLRTLGITPTVFKLPGEISGDFDSREYQTNAIKSLVNAGRGIFVLPTASGKSFVIAKTLWSMLRSSDKIKHCLILVPSTSLVIQFYKDLLEYGIPNDRVSTFSSKSKDCQNTEIIISNRQWMERHIGELPEIDVLFCDECHGLKSGSKTSDMVGSFRTNVRFGCTATLPNEIKDKWELIGLLGPVLYKKTVVSMQADNFIAPLAVTSVNVFDRLIDADTTCLFSMKRKVKSEDIQEPYELERKYIVDNIDMLYRQVVDHIVFSTSGTNTLFLFDYLPFGKALLSIVKEIAPDPEKVFYIDGSVDVDVREAVRQSVEKHEDVYIIAQSTCFNTGINIKNLHNIAFVFNSKSSSKVVQSIGRGLRKHPSKDHVDLFDVNFNFKYSTKHFAQRKKIYSEIYNLPIATKVTIKV